ncbi:MAG: hypothetical protein WC340_12480 [Kiritimatiellia bacterium]
MKQSFILAGLIAIVSGCASVDPVWVSPAMPPMDLSPNKPYSALDTNAQRGVLEDELRVIGKALQAYATDHNGALPPKLTTLVEKKYLSASALISSADPSQGQEGGVPDLYTTWEQAKATDESGSSYLYEFSAAPCGWDWKTYIAGDPTPEKMDANKDGIVSWAEVKSWQMAHGDTVQQPQGGYPKSAFPVVRCFWYKYPEVYTEDAAESVVLNLAVDLRTVFASHAWWEKDFNK